VSGPLTGDLVFWRELLAVARAELEAAGTVESPDIDVRRIIETVTGASGAGYETALDQPVTQLAKTRFDAMVRRRCAGEPLQYVVGAWGFRTLDLMVDQRVLIPRPETEVVAGFAITILQRKAASRDEVIVADLGTGSGAIALSVAVECPNARVFATDVSVEALGVARANLAGAGRAASRVSLHEGDWFAALPSELMGSLDMVVSNPPYIAAGEHLPDIAAGEHLPAVITGWEPEVALWSGPSGDEATREVIAGAAEWLRPQGALVLEVASQRARQTADQVTGAGFRDVVVERDLAGLERVVMGWLP